MLARPIFFGGGLPSWLPLASGGTAPLVFGDFAGGNYWFNNASHASFSAWNTASGGTFSRASSATYFDNAGVLQTAGNNVARFVYDPVSHASLGLRLTGARTNLCLWNRDLTNAAWVASNITPLKDQTGIDGAANAASSLTAAAGNGTILQSITSGSASRMQSAYVKRLIGSGVINMTMDGGTTWSVIVPTASYTNLTVPNATVTNPQVGFRIVTSGDAIAVDYVQNEVGAFASDGILTTAASATEAADSLIIGPTGGVPFTGFSASAGTMLVGQRPDDLSATYGIWRAYNSGDSGNYRIFENTLAATVYNNQVTSAGSGVYNQSVGVPVVGTSKKSGLAWAANDFQAVAAGTLATAGASGAVPTGLDTLQIGASANAGFGDISTFAYWPSRLSNADLVRLST